MCRHFIALSNFGEKSICHYCGCELILKGPTLFVTKAIKAAPSSPVCEECGRREDPALSDIYRVIVSVGAG